MYSNSIEEGIKKFLLGRQMIVVPMGFLTAQITQFTYFPSGILPYGIYYILIIIGFPGIMVLLQLAQLIPQLIAENHSVKFLGIPGAYYLVRLALCIEKLGITDYAWIMYSTISKIINGDCESSPWCCYGSDNSNQNSFSLDMTSNSMKKTRVPTYEDV
jgi:hypothetical protein